MKIRPETCMQPLLAVLALSAAPVHAATQNFSTGEFIDAQWSSQTTADSTGSGTAITEVDGGNPGAYRRLSLVLGPDQTAVQVSLWSVASFDPSVRGRIDSVSLSYDLSRVSSSLPSATQIARGIAVMQDGVIHRSHQGVTAIAIPDWEHFEVTDLVPLFPAVDWIAGSAITFGLFNSAGALETGFTIDGGYDNFAVSVEFTPVPLPAAAWMFAAAAAPAMRMRRRA
ncbi:MAG: hypothetical protein AB7Q97_16805 [Gammaproteobacteria bacterium]